MSPRDLLFPPHWCGDCGYPSLCPVVFMCLGDRNRRETSESPSVHVEPFPQRASILAPRAWVSPVMSAVATFYTEWLSVRQLCVHSGSGSAVVSPCTQAVSTNASSIYLQSAPTCSPGVWHSPLCQIPDRWLQPLMTQRALKLGMPAMGKINR